MSVVGHVHAAEILGEPIATTIVAVAVAIAVARNGVRAAAAFLAIVACGGAALVALRVAARSGWLTPLGPYFPSGHVGAPAIVLGTVVVLMAGPGWRRGLIAVGALAVIATVAAGRVSAGAHPPADILGALAVAVGAWGAAVSRRRRDAAAWRGAGPFWIVTLGYPAIAGGVHLWMPKAAALFSGPRVGAGF